MRFIYFTLAIKPNVNLCNVLAMQIILPIFHLHLYLSSFLFFSLWPCTTMQTFGQKYNPYIVKKIFEVLLTQNGLHYLTQRDPVSGIHLKALRFYNL